MNSRRGFTLVELLAMIGILGVLVALLLPAVQSARESARRTSCGNNMRQLAVAVLSYESTHGTLPPAGMTNTPDIVNGACNLHGDHATDGSVNYAPWTVRILPNMDDLARYQQYDLTETGNTTAAFSATTNSPHGAGNKGVQFKANPLYKCPSDPSATSPANSFILSYLAVTGGGPSSAATCNGGSWLLFSNGLFRNNVAMRVAAATDGLSNVFALGETRYPTQWIYRNPGWSSHRAVGWDAGLIRWGTHGSYYYSGVGATYNQINYSPCDPQRYDQNIPGCPVDYMRQQSFGSHHPGGCFFSTADGAIRFVSDTIDITAFRSLGIRNDGLPLGDLWNYQ